MILSLESVCVTPSRKMYGKLTKYPQVLKDIMLELAEGLDAYDWSRGRRGDRRDHEKGVQSRRVGFNMRNLDPKGTFTVISSDISA